MARTDPQVNIRMPEPLLERLRAAAQANGQTLAAEIISRLDASFPKSLNLLVLESRQRELEAMSARRMELQWLMQEHRLKLSPADLEKLQAELQRMEAIEQKAWQEIDAMYATLRDREGVESPVG